MTGYAATCDGIEQRILDGFTGALRPTDVDDIGPAYENPGFGELLGKAWTDVPFETVWLLRWDLMWFEAQGFRYYLPAFLRGALRDGEVAETVVTYLMSGVGHRESLWPSEKQVVRDVLRCLRDRDEHDHGAAEALASYWETLTFEEADLERERLARALFERFPPDPADRWVEWDPARRWPRDARDLVAMGTRELCRVLPAHLHSLIEGRLTRVDDVLSPPRTPDRQVLDELVRLLSPSQAELVGEILAFVGKRVQRADDAETARYWSELAASP